MLIASLVRSGGSSISTFLAQCTDREHGFQGSIDVRPGLVRDHQPRLEVQLFTLFVFLGSICSKQIAFSNSLSSRNLNHAARQLLRSCLPQ